MIWLEILKHAPSILAAADTLRTRVGANAGDRTRSVEARLAELEDESRAAAQLTRDMAQQIVSAEPWHPDVEEDHLRFVLMEHRERAFSVVGHSRLSTHVLDEHGCCSR